MSDYSSRDDIRTAALRRELAALESRPDSPDKARRIAQVREALGDAPTPTPSRRERAVKES